MCIIYKYVYISGCNNYEWGGKGFPSDDFIPQLLFSVKISCKKEFFHCKATIKITDVTETRVIS